MCDTIIAAPFPESIETVADPDCIVDYSKDMKNMKEIFKYNELFYLVTAEMKMPWPIKNRELCMQVGTFIDPYNRACFSISKSIPEDHDVLGFKAPKCKKGL